MRLVQLSLSRQIQTCDSSLLAISLVMEVTGQRS